MVQSIDLKGILSVLVSIVVFVTSENKTEVLDAIGQSIQKELIAVKQPIDETIAAVGSSQCENIKQLFGLRYEQVKGEREPDVDKLTLVYKTRSSSRVYNISSAANEIRQARGIDLKEKLLFFIHGFTDDPNQESFQVVSDGLLDSGAASSVVALDGSPLIRWLYIRASTYVYFIGIKLAQMLADLVKHGQDPALIHMIGHSLGAHISGFTGKQFFLLTGKRLGRISGLDPAGPCFTEVNSTMRLNRTDADYVDVMHTDAGVFGIKEPVGDADYFPNNGTMQPRCTLQSCSHSRSWRYYAESALDELAFAALRCESWEHFQMRKCFEETSSMGYHSKPGTKGLFFLQTGGTSPFGLFLEGTKYKNNNGLIANVHEAVIKEIPKNIPLIRNFPIIG